MENFAGSLITLLIALAITIGLFLIFRFLVLWYFKIDKRVELQIKQNNLLHELITEIRNEKKED